MSVITYMLLLPLRLIWLVFCLWCWAFHIWVGGWTQWEWRDEFYSALDKIKHITQREDR